MGEKEEIKYTEKEEREIERIISLLPTEEIAALDSMSTPETEPEDASPRDSVNALDDGIDDDFDIDGSEFDEPVYDSPAAGDDEADDDDDDVVDISDLIEEVDETDEPVEAALDEPAGIETIDFGEEPAHVDVVDEEIPALDDIQDFDSDISLDEAAPARPDKEPKSTLEELDALADFDAAAEEPQGVDTIAADDGMSNFDGSVSDEELDAIDLSGLDDIAQDEPQKVTLEDQGGDDIPDLSEISLGEVQEIPDAKDEDIPEIDLSDLGETGGAAALDEPEPMDEISAADDDTGSIHDELSRELDGMDSLEMFDDEKPAADAPRKRSAADEDDFTDIPAIDEIEDIAHGDGMDDVHEEKAAPARKAPAGDARGFAPDDDERPRDAAPEKKKAKDKERPVTRERDESGDFELSDRDLKKIKKAIVLYHPALRKAVRDTILNDELAEKDMRQFLDMILSGKSEDAIRRFLEKKLDISIDTSTLDDGAGTRRVIASRPEYTAEGMERQKHLFKLTRIIGIAAVIAFMATILSYQFIYKPVMAKRYINEGVALIRKPGEPVMEKMQHYKLAEDNFRYVDENLIRNYLYGYNAYARAYFEKQQYAFSYEKLVKAYEIEPAHAETLNNLGYFFSRVPQPYFMRIRGTLQNNFYKKSQLVPGDKATQLDIAIDFYKRSLLVEAENVNALYGIGNAYMYQGEYFKAREFYERILKTKKNEVVGYSGLLNLFIERDNFPEMLSVHSELRHKELMTKVPSALLAKLSAYYLSKKRTETRNIRIDYGIQSGRIRDIDDNPYPAVRSVLDDLKIRDVDYPPLYLHNARLSRAQKSLKLMQEYLKTAIKKEPNYFGALHLLGEYHLMVKEPSEAYACFRRALKAHLNPPEFTRDDFYYETEQVGRTYAMLGNIFYYFFDKVKYRYGDEIEDEEIDKTTEKLANYKIARDNYEMALQSGYRSPELFYNLGRIYYMKGLYENYEKAVENWLNLYEDFPKHGELMFALGNAFYHLNNLEASKGEFLKMVSVLEHEAERIGVPSTAMTEQVNLFQTLSSVYNNLGAVYQRQDDEVKSNICYWKAIDYAKRIDRENEFARVNMARANKDRDKEISPILDENIPPFIDAYRDYLK